MSLNAATIEFLLSKGLTGEDLLEIARRSEMRSDPTAAQRMRNYRDRKRETRNVTRNDPPYEDISTPQPPSPTKVGSGGKRKRKTAFPVDFKPEMSGATKTTVDGWPPGRLEDELQSFRDCHTAKGTLSYDWQANWRYWVTNSKRWEPKNGRGRQQSDSLRGARPDPAFDMWLDAKRDLEAERNDPPPDFGTRLALPPFGPS